MILCIVLLIYYTCDVNICVEIDPGTHMRCTRLCPLETGVTALPLPSPSWAPRGPYKRAAHPLLLSFPCVAHPRLGPDWRGGGPTAPTPSPCPARRARGRNRRRHPLVGPARQPHLLPKLPPFLLSLSSTPRTPLSFDAISPHRAVSSLPPLFLPPSFPSPAMALSGRARLPLSRSSQRRPRPPRRAARRPVPALARLPGISPLPQCGFPRPASAPVPASVRTALERHNYPYLTR
jgi:hypothetical protein